MYIMAYLWGFSSMSSHRHQNLQMLGSSINWYCVCREPTHILVKTVSTLGYLFYPVQHRSYYWFYTGDQGIMIRNNTACVCVCACFA